MSSCEKCWADAHVYPFGDVAERYQRLMEERKDTPCTPEQQAGQGAGECPICHRMTMHQHTGEPMCGCDTPRVRP